MTIELDLAFEDPDDNYRLLSNKVHTARKERRCRHCDWKISPGQSYRSLVHLDGRDFKIMQFHSDMDECAEAAAECDVFRARGRAEWRAAEAHGIELPNW